MIGHLPLEVQSAKMREALIERRLSAVRLCVAHFAVTSYHDGWLVQEASFYLTTNTTMSATTASLSTAEKARRKAEARRLRILAKGKQRFDVVNGLAPSDVIKNDTPPVTPVASSPTAADDDDVIQPMVETVDSTDIISVNSSDERKAKAAERMEATSQSAEGGTQSKGARRMAAMRKRRYQSKNKPAAMADKNEDGKFED